MIRDFITANSRIHTKCAHQEIESNKLFGLEWYSKISTCDWYSFVRAEGRGTQSNSGKQSTWALKVYFDMSEVDV